MGTWCPRAGVHATLSFVLRIYFPSLTTQHFGSHRAHSIVSLERVKRLKSTKLKRNNNVFQVEDAEANSAPSKSELIFDKYGDRYFLARVFDEGNPDGSKVPESQYEKRVSQAATEAQEHVPA